MFYIDDKFENELIEKDDFSEKEREKDLHRKRREFVEKKKQKGKNRENAKKKSKNTKVPPSKKNYSYEDYEMEE